MIENPKLNPSFYTIQVQRQASPHHTHTPIFAQYSIDYLLQLGNLSCKIFFT